MLDEDHPLNISIIATSTNENYGSMTKYAELLLAALSLVGQEKINIQILNLGPGKIFLDRIPRWSRTVFYHGYLIFKAIKLRNLKIDIVHVVDGSYAHVLRWLPSATASVVTSHDIIPMLQATGYFHIPKPGIVSRFIIRQSIKGLRMADAIIAVSENTKKDLVENAGIVPERIHVILSAVPQSISVEKHQAQWEKRRAASNAYILHVGGDGFYKNRQGVVRIFQKVREKVNIRLIMVGPEPSKEMLDLIKSMNLAERVEFIVHPDDRVLTKLYANACLFLFPSIYEGYGWPPLEAMTLNCPVVSSNRASLPEVLGSAALTADPDDEAQMAELCLSVLEDNELANKLIAKGVKQAGKFIAEEMGQKIREVYAKVIAQRKSGTREPEVLWCL